MIRGKYTKEYKTTKDFGSTKDKSYRGLLVRKKYKAQKKEAADEAASYFCKDVAQTRDCSVIIGRFRKKEGWNEGKLSWS